MLQTPPCYNSAPVPVAIDNKVLGVSFVQGGALNGHIVSSLYISGRCRLLDLY